MNILMLDVDGVLNNELTTERIICTINGATKVMKAIDAELFANLQLIIEQTDVYFVLHSTWRNFHDTKQHVAEMLGDRLIGSTPCFGNPRSSAAKAIEIAAFLKTQDYQKVAILDDHAEAEIEGIKFFKPDYRGLTREMAQEIVEFFNAETKTQTQSSIEDTETQAG
jgi:glutamine synthetase